MSEHSFNVHAASFAPRSQQSDTPPLSILSYNVHTSSTIMAALLADNRVKDFDVVALQEPWKNPAMEATVCPAHCAFTPLTGPVLGRACILVNKRLDQSSYRVVHHSADFISIHFSSDNFWVHNLYFPCSSSSNYRASAEQALGLLPDALSAPGRHLLVGDSNLSHPLWSSPSSHPSVVARVFADCLLNANLELARPPGEITWQSRGLSSSIDVAFISTSAYPLLLSSDVRRDLDFGSDHFPTATQLLVDAPRQQREPQRAWRAMDLEELRRRAPLLPTPQNLGTPQAIDDYLCSLFDFLETTANHVTPIKPPSTFATKWWTREIRDLVKSMRNTRRLAHRGLATWDQFQEARRLKHRAIQKAKREAFREALHELGQSDKFWPLVRWAKEKSGTPPAPRTVPDLTSGQSTATTFEEKTEVFRRQFYPPAPDTADLSDVGEPHPDGPIPVSRATPLTCPQVSADDIIAAMKKKKPFSAPGCDGYPNAFLKALGEPLAEALAPVFTACWRTGYYPSRFKVARTVCLQKPNKGNYDNPKSWRPIALLSTVGKLLDAVTSSRIASMAEEYNMLPSIQMGCRRQRSTETALAYLCTSVKQVWKSNRVCSLLSLDLSGAFDRVLPLRLGQCLRRKRVPEWVIAFVMSFCSGRSTTLAFDGRESQPFPVTTGVPQGSPLSPLLFLFYMAELNELVHQPSRGLLGLGYADDTNILAYGLKLRGNLAKLRKVHKDCIKWAVRHGMVFSPEKYGLLHLSRRRLDKSLLSSLSLRLEGITVQPAPDALRILGAHLDSKLLWNHHIKRAIIKARGQMAALARTSYSTWGLPLLKARLVYMAVLRSSLTYAAGVWAAPGRKYPELEVFQNKCLRSIGGAFKATPGFLLESELYVPPISLYLTARYARLLSSLQNSPTATLLDSTSVHTLRPPRVPNHTAATPAPDWISTAREALPDDSWQEPEKALRDCWTETFLAQKERLSRSLEVFTESPMKSNLKVHTNIHKAKSSLIVQSKTARIGLASFLYRARVPDFDSPSCRCSSDVEETFNHLVFECPLYADERQRLLEDLGSISGNGTWSMKEVFACYKATRTVTTWFLSLGHIQQFSHCSPRNDSDNSTST